MEENFQKEENNSQCQSVPPGNTKTGGTNALYRWQFTLKSSYKNDSKQVVPIVPEYLATILKEHCKEFYFQLELSEGGYEHYQGCLSLITKHRLGETKNLLGFKKIHLEPVKNWHALVNYSTKLNTRKEGPWSHKSSFIKIIDKLRPWQADLYDELLTEADDRTILWIWDPIGKMGKTVLSKYLAIKLGAIVVNNGSFTDLAYVLPDSPKIVIFNLPRQIEGRVNYTAIESIKDGLIFSGKYKSKTKMFNPPHVVIFANFSPDMSALSKDRWLVYSLGDEKKREEISDIET